MQLLKSRDQYVALLCPPMRQLFPLAAACSNSLPPGLVHTSRLRVMHLEVAATSNCYKSF